MNQSRIPAEFLRFPLRWKVVAFNQAISDESGGNAKVKTGEYLESGLLPVIDQGESPIAGFVNDISLQCKAQLPCILFGDHTRIFKFVDRPFVLGADGVKVLVPSPELDPKFGYYYLRQVRLPENAGYSRHFKFLKETYVPLPPLPEQRRIAAILDKADAVRRKRQEAIRLTEGFLRSAFLEMFGDPVTNPKGWPIVKLVRTFVEKPQIGTTVPAHDGGKCAVIRVGELGGYDVALERCKRVTLQDNELERFQAKPGDLLLARAIGSEDHLGKASMLQKVNKTMVFDSHVMRLRFKSDWLRPLFFLQWLKTRGGRTRFMRRAGRTAVQFNVNAKQIADIDIPLPSVSDQKQFLEIFGKSRNLYQRQMRLCNEQDNLFNALVQRAFRGEL